MYFYTSWYHMQGGAKGGGFTRCIKMDKNLSPDGARGEFTLRDSFARGYIINLNGFFCCQFPFSSSYIS